MAKKQHRTAKNQLTFEELVELQERAEKTQESIWDVVKRAQKLQLEAIQDFFEKFREKGMDLPHERIRDIKRELADIRQKQVDYQALLQQVFQLMDLIKLKKGLIQILDNEGFKAIIHRMKITEILIKNQLLLRLLILNILKLLEIKILHEKLALAGGCSDEPRVKDELLDDLRAACRKLEPEQADLVRDVRNNAPDIHADFMELWAPQAEFLDEMDTTRDAVRVADHLLYCPK